MKSIVEAEPFEILLVDDDAGDVRLTAEAIRRSNLRVNLHVASDGIEALDFLRKRGPYAAAPAPDLILLDLNMPRKSGHEVLSELKSDPGLSHIPVVVLTTSAADEDVLRCYRLHANCYVTKPIDLGRFVHVVEMIDYFWFSIVRLPHEHCRIGTVS